MRGQRLIKGPSQLTNILRSFPRSSPGSLRRRDSFTRVDIISEKLCDDVIQYLAPTLEKHKGCTLIDVHPGACVWSSKLHEFLQPKWHLLMEPDDLYFEPFIKPLLDIPGSTYRHTSIRTRTPAMFWTSYREICEDPSLLPPRPTLPKGDLRLRRLDPGILVTGNLARASTSRAYEEYAPLFLHQASFGVLGNENYQNAGLVRMLWWIPEILKNIIFTGNRSTRKGLQAALEMGLDISDVAGVRSLLSIIESRRVYYKFRKPFSAYGKIVNEEVINRMKENAVTVPKDRQLLTVENPIRAVDSRVVSPLTISFNSVSALQAKVSATASRTKKLSTWIADKRFSKRRSRKFDYKPEEALKTLEYPQCIPAVEEYHSFSKTHLLRVPILLDMALRVVNIEANFKHLEEQRTDSKSLEQLRQSIEKLDRDLDALTKATGLTNLTVVEDLLEDDLLHHTRLLARDRRPLEPLQVDTSDFFPKTDLFLLDALPRSIDLSTPDLADTPESSKLCSELLSAIFMSPSMSLPDALDKVAVNAGKDLIPMVPAITDTRKGGRMNPDKVRVRMLTTEMVEGLVKAFFEWPFRPLSWELALNASDADVSSNASAGSPVSVGDDQ